jgi:UDP-glucose:(heptosyl)LPS alpha-1,3-glucosyltransferase
MVEEDYDVHVYTERWEQVDPKIHFHLIQPLSFPRSIRLLSFSKKATHEIEKGNYDLTFGVGNTLRADILQPHGGVHWAWFWRSLEAYDRPLWWTIKFLGRVISPKQWVSGWIENSPYRGEGRSRFVAISDRVKQDMIRWYDIPEDQITVVYNGVDINHFHPQNRQYRDEVRKRHGIGEEFVVLFVSNNFRMKGLNTLMKTLAMMKREGDSSLKLIVLGRDRQAPYQRLAHRLGIFENMVFAGATAEVEKYYGAADLLVHPSFYDACSLTVLEALASGLPVITTRSNGAGGVITEGQEGFVLADPRDCQALSQRISYFLDERKRKEASLAARRLAERYPMERNWREMKHLFHQKMSEKQPNP